MQYFYNPFTDYLQEIEQPFQFPNDLRQTRITAAVARSISKKEAEDNDEAKAALRKEWARLREIGTWDEGGVREYDDLVKEFRARQEDNHFGRLFAILVEKNSELPLGHKDRTCKGRVALDRSDVRDRDREIALFPDLSSSPATSLASKAG